MSKYEAFILAGGKSSRMGAEKGLMDFNGSPMIQKTIDVLKEIDADIKIIANNEDYVQFGYPVFKDEVKEMGPLGGIYTALLNANSDKVIVLSCDTPFVSTEVLERLIGESKNHQVTIAKDEDGVHPLIGVYSRDLVEAVKQSIDKNDLKIMTFIESTEYKVVAYKKGEDGVTENTFSNINTKEELEQLKACK